MRQFLLKFSCRTCTIETAEDIEKEMNRKLFPRFCIGHVAMVVTGIVIVITELLK